MTAYIEVLLEVLVLGFVEVFVMKYIVVLVKKLSK